MELQLANPTNPGLPPSSVASFLKANGSLSVALLAEFDSSYTNEAFAAPHDDLAGINYEGIAAVAQLLAQNLFDQAYEPGAAFQVKLALQRKHGVKLNSL